MTRMGRAWLLVFLAGAGCGTESPESSCLPPNRVIGERCVAPGVQDDGCAAGSLGREDGSCQAAGVPAALCAAGFVHDGDAACEPILPAEPCPKGQMAVPGESSCRLVAPCGAGKWGDIPVDGATVHVDASYAGGSSDGSAQRPWSSIGAAVAAAAPGALIAIAAGSYVEDVLVEAPLRLVGVCPDLVELVATGAASSALSFRPASGGSELRGIAVTGNAVGIVVFGAQGALLEDLWVHDTPRRGIDITGFGDQTSATVRNVLVEGTREDGIFVWGASATLAGVVVRHTLPRTSDQTYGDGVSVLANTIRPADVTIETSLVDENHDSGIYVVGSRATLEGVVIRRTLPQASDGLFGRGISAEPDDVSSLAPTIAVTSSLVEDNYDYGVFASGAETTLDGVVVRRTWPRQSDQAYGRPIGIQRYTNPNALAVIRSSLVEDGYGIGIHASGVQLTIEGVSIRRIAPEAIDGLGGRGISVEIDPSLTPSTAVIAGAVIEDCHEFGVLLTGSTATLDAVLVRSTSARPIDGNFGDGLTVVEALVDFERVGGALVAHSRIEQSARAGVGNFGSDVAIDRTALSCNGFDIDGEAIADLQYAFDNLGGNGCGCPDATGECIARSSGLRAPEVLVDGP
jgi:hypothetical protein